MPITQRFRGRYGMAVSIALLGLCPNIVLSTAFLPLSQVICADLGASQLQLGLAEGLSNAGYAFGAVLAAQLAQRYVQRRLFLWFEALFVVGSVLAAAAPGIGLFFAGRLLQGSATGFMLISALPPLVTRFGVGKLPGTGPPHRWRRARAGGPAGPEPGARTRRTPAAQRRSRPPRAA